jgi:hypothetical protein
MSRTLVGDIHGGLKGVAIAVFRKSKNNFKDTLIFFEDC